MAKERKLTEKEQKRLDKFNEVSASMEAEGYKKTELTVSIMTANVFAVLLLIPVGGVGIWLYYLRHHMIEGFMSNFLLFVAVFAICIVVHELIHGISWSLFTKNHFGDIDFGIMRDSFTPYCTCSQPLSKGQYIFGAMMPLVVLGLIPMAAGILMGSFRTLLMGIIMTDSAAGDILIVRNILRYRSDAKDIVYMDHPTEAGGVIFER